MIQLFRTLSVVLLVVRLMVGCCAHDSPGCDSKHISSAPPCGATMDGQCPACGNEHSPSGPGECQRPKCSMASPRRAAGGSFSPPWQALFAGLPNAHLARLAIGRQQQSRRTGRLLLPVRLHLANQVLLI